MCIKDTQLFKIVIKSIIKIATNERIDKNERTSCYTQMGKELFVQIRDISGSIKNACGFQESLLIII